MRVEELLNFIRARHEIYLVRQSGDPPPWTDDPILGSFRFCNVYRELDRVSAFVNSWLRRHDPEDVWFAAVVARLTNEPDTMEALGRATPWCPDRYVRVIKSLMERGRAYNPAYMISVAGLGSGSKPVLQAEFQLTPMWRRRKMLRPSQNDTLQSWAMQLGIFNGIGSFISAQVVADVKHFPPLLRARDWWTFAQSGPGSRRGLNRVMGREVRAPWTEDAWRLRLAELQTEVDKVIWEWCWPRLDAQNLQNCLCEFDKYERARLGEGRPKQRYVARRR